MELRSEINPGDSATQPFRVILRKTNRNEFVTHVENLIKAPQGGFQSKPSRDTYWGHYFRADDAVNALLDFKTRCAKYGLADNAELLTEVQL